METVNCPYQEYPKLLKYRDLTYTITGKLQQSIGNQGYQRI